MKKALLLITVVLGLSSFGWAGTCASGTLAQYSVAGFTCTIDNLTFSKFTYTSAGATAPTAVEVSVTPDGEGFQFTGAFNAGPMQTADGFISFIVSAPSATISSIEAAMGGYGFRPDGTVSVAENASNGADIFMFSNSGGTVASGQVNFKPVNSLKIMKDIAANGGLRGSAAVSQIVDQFNQVPEPGSMALLGSGLLALGGFIRRRVRS